ncbi:MarR family winged helix-turn-helix transcriptional regulator [Ktedonospora formicarum]|nr:MarR family transcriptional regulator [Ktedonospora formicarum]
MRVVHLLGRNQGRGLREMKLDPTAIRILEFLATNGPTQLKTLTQEMSLLPSSITRHLQGLESAGYATVINDPVDRRARLASITERGQEECQRLNQIGITMFSAVIADWNPEEVQVFTTLLKRLADHISGPRLSQQELHAYLDHTQES